jgi:hypothetical protein
MDDGARQTWIERILSEAQEQGRFDNLEGAGRPINWADESLVQEEWAMAFRLMREHGFAPEWIELHKEIGRELKEAREDLQRAWRWRQDRLPEAREGQRYVQKEWRRALAAFEESVAELNAKIADFNLTVPIVNLQKLKLNVAEELAYLGIDP